MPLTFNRNFQGMLVTVPGATRPHREHSAFFNSQDSLSTEVNGQSRLANNTHDRGRRRQPEDRPAQVIIPAADALETVSVTTSNYDAEFGRSGGAITNVTLKSGTNSLKGSGFFFGNNEKTNAGDYFSHLKAPTKFVNGGFTLGGPIVREQAVLLRRLPAHASTTTATSSARSCRRWRCGTATSARVASTSTIRRPAISTAPTARRSPTTRSPRIGSARSRRRCSRSSRCRTSPAPRSARTTSSRRRRARRPPTASTPRSTTRISQKDQMSGAPQLHAAGRVRSGPVRRQYGGPANGGFAGTGTNTSYSTAGTWTRVVQQDDGAGRPRRHELLPQHHVDRPATA